MSLRIRDLVLTLDEKEDALAGRIAAFIGCSPDRIIRWSIVRKGIDARRKPNVLRVYTLDVVVTDEERILEAIGEREKIEKTPVEKTFTVVPVSVSTDVVVVGMGPAGLFSALVLAESGARVTLLERGRPVEQRLEDVRRFWDTGLLDETSNVQFGEGGAGTFSDGKLTTRINHPGISMVLQRLVEFGAPEEILYQAKPHIGSDRLRKVLINFRRKLISLGVDIRFSSTLTGFEMSNRRITASIVNDGELIPCRALVLAVGHSARDTYKMLSRAGVALEPKPFAMGLRVEHPQELINRIQYGFAAHPFLPAADYRLSWNDPDTGRGVYSFCMCPGGVVINASSEAGCLVVNGMSDYRRDAPLANSALVVSVTPADFTGNDSLAGVRFQQRWERAAWTAGKPGWHAPAQPLTEFFSGKAGRLSSSCRPEVTPADLKECLPPYVAEALRRALPYFERKMRGFISREATLVGVETRTSAPVRILRGADGQSISHAGLYPAGEGAGYAGGIMSAAIDGMTAAVHVLHNTQP